MRGLQSQKMLKLPHRIVLIHRIALSSKVVPPPVLMRIFGASLLTSNHRRAPGRGFSIFGSSAFDFSVVLLF